jgi:hypothetical protein
LLFDASVLDPVPEWVLDTDAPRADLEVEPLGNQGGEPAPIGVASVVEGTEHAGSEEHGFRQDDQSPDALASGTAIHVSKPPAPVRPAAEEFFVAAPLEPVLDDAFGAVDVGMVAVTVEEFAQSGVGVNDLGGSGETDGEVLGFVPPVSVIATNEVGRSSAVGPDGDVPGDSAPDHAGRAGGRGVVAAEQPNDAGVRGVRRQRRPDSIPG